MRILALLCGLLLAAPARGADDLDALVQAALAANPDLAARRARVDELGALADVSRAWPDPMFGVEASNLPVDSFRLDRHPMSGVQLELQQTIPAPGSRKRSSEVAEAKVAASEQMLAESELQLRAAVETTWWQLVLNRQLQGVVTRHIADTDELIAAVRARYEVGGTGQSNLLRFQLLRDQLQESLSDLEQDERVTVAALRKAIAHPEHTFATPAQTDPLGVTGDADRWLAAARTSRPLLRQIDAEVTEAEARAALARASAAPDVTLWAGYRIRVPQVSGDPGVDFFSLGASVPIPVSSAHVAAGQRDAALQAAKQAEARKASALDQIRSDLRSIDARWARADDKATSYDQTLVPEAQQTLDTTLSDYRVGKADFASLYEAEVALLQLDRATRVAKVETHIQQSRARAAIGTEPPRGIR